MKKIAIIGASLFQEPLIKKAKDSGLETHVFAWASDDVGEKIADYFYPISITEKEQILEKCKEIGIDGICTIGSDLGTVAVNYTGNNLGLNCNSIECTEISTNKHAMRIAFENNNVPSPKSVLAASYNDLYDMNLEFPVIVKPTDRSGSRGINKVYNNEELKNAIDAAIDVSFEKKALVEEFAEGQEYSVECISYHGIHHFLAMTKKFTSGEPHFVETGHIEPAPEENFTYKEIQEIVFHALDSLKITEGASHTELKIAGDGSVKIIEIGARMGGDFIGSHLVELSTGIDFVKAVIDVAMNREPDITPKTARTSYVRFIFDKTDLDLLNKIKKEHPEYLFSEEIHEITSDEISDSSSRHGHFILCTDSINDLLKMIGY
ncbi:MAG: ATP-grasp domain-containing protein [Lachnospiraceae bacterium]|nr:ATP-grasp domain-containing protein [Lachnospiraceae bacterium]